MIGHLTYEQWIISAINVVLENQIRTPGDVAQELVSARFPA